MQPPRKILTALFLLFLAVGSLVLWLPRERQAGDTSIALSLESTVEFTEAPPAAAVEAPKSAPEVEVARPEPMRMVSNPYPSVFLRPARHAVNVFKASIAMPTRPANRVERLLERYDFSGVALARRQVERGLWKRVERVRRRDQSFQGLRDIIADSNDPEVKAFLPVAKKLQSVMENRDDAPRTYTRDFIQEMAPLARLIQDETGLPASVLMAQLIVESGWGGSNITILKNNVLGIGNADQADDFTVTVDLGEIHRDVRVRALKDTTAFAFDSVGDCILYYVYVLLQSPDNAVHYQPLRDYIASHRELLDKAPDRYRDRVVALIAEGYHSNPDWYEEYLASLIDKVKPVETRSMSLLLSENRNEG